MRKNNKKQIVLDKIAKKLNFCDKIIMKVFKRYTLNIYRMGFHNGFIYCNSKGCNKAVITKKQKIENRKIKIVKTNGE